MDQWRDRKNSPNSTKRTPLRPSVHQKCFRVWTWSHGWDAVEDQLQVFTSTPIDPNRTSMVELLDWEVSALLERCASMTSQSSGYESTTPVARAHSRRRINRKLLDKSISDAKDALRTTRVNRGQVAMVKKFMVSEEKLKMCKITNNRRLRL